jgi:hypothetical protein
VVAQIFITQKARVICGNLLKDMSPEMSGIDAYRSRRCTPELAVSPDNPLAHGGAD